MFLFFEIVQTTVVKQNLLGWRRLLISKTHENSGVGVWEGWRHILITKSTYVFISELHEFFSS